MLIGYMRLGKANGSESISRQPDVLLAAGVDPTRLYEDHASDRRANRPGLRACLTSLQPGDTLVTWKLDRLGRDLRHLATLACDLAVRGVDLRLLASGGAAIDTTTPNGRLVSGVVAAFPEFERALIVERTKAGLASVRIRGRLGGRPYKVTPAKLCLAQAAMGRREAGVGRLCAELGVTRQRFYRHMDPQGWLRPDGERLLCHRRGSERERRRSAGVPGPEGDDRHV